MDTFLRPCIEDFRFSMSEQMAALLLLLLLVLLLALVLLLLLLLQPVTSTAVTTHAAASRPPSALHRTVTPLLIAGQARQLDSWLKHPAGRTWTHHPRRANATSG
jgi:hypothetical protein